MENLTETFDELNLGCEKTLCKQFNEGGNQYIFIFQEEDWEKEEKE